MSVSSPFLKKDAVSYHREPDSVLPILDHLAELSCKKRTKVSTGIRFLNLILMLLFLVVVLGLAFLPWQQFARGRGSVIAFDPLERSVVVESPLSGRIARAYVVEGQEVRTGDLLFEIVDNDPDLRANLQSQRDAAASQRLASETRVNLLLEQLVQVEAAVPQVLLIEERRLEAVQAALITAEKQWNRIRALYEDQRGLASQRDFEVATLEKDRLQAEKLRAESSVLRAKLDQAAKIEGMKASIESARSDLNKAERDLNSLDIRLSQVGRQKVTAPRGGVVFRVQSNEGAFLKAGAPLCTVIPRSKDLVVQMWIDGNDMPLLQEREVDDQGKVIRSGSTVRLQFEGWPAIQFVGWPSVARGTFGGEVIFIDAVDDGKGSFRVLVAPKEDIHPTSDGGEERTGWPGPPVMRQGISAQGWVLLERVPLWYEAWRQLNGFPPALQKDRADSLQTQKTK